MQLGRLAVPLSRILMSPDGAVTGEDGRLLVRRRGAPVRLAGVEVPAGGGLMSEAGALERLLRPHVRPVCGLGGRGLTMFQFAQPLPQLVGARTRVVRAGFGRVLSALAVVSWCVTHCRGVRRTQAAGPLPPTASWTPVTAV